MSETLERIVRFEPAYDKRDSNPKKNYGIHGVTLRMVLKGSKGATQFVLFTNWHLPHVQAELDNRINDRFPHLSCHPLPSDLGYHSKTPHYEGQEAVGAVRYRPNKMQPEEIGSFTKTGTFDPCEFTDGGSCYYDGSSLQAEEVYHILLHSGSEGVWKLLEERYHSLFDEPTQAALEVQTSDS